MPKICVRIFDSGSPVAALAAVVALATAGCAKERSASVRTALYYAEAPPPSEASWRADSPAGDTAAAEVPSPTELPEDVLSLAVAREIAVRDNPDVEAAWARLTAAVAQVDEAASRKYPTVAFRHTTALTTQTARNRPRLTSVLQSVEQLPAVTGTIDPLEGVNPLIRPLLRPLFGTPSIGSNTNAFTDNSTALTATWTVFDGFIREAQIAAAQHARSAARASLSDVRRLLVHAVDAAYHQIQLAEEQLRIAQADEEFSRDQLEETEKLRQANRASAADVDNFRVRMLAAQANVTAAIGARDTGRVVLAELMGIGDVALPEGLSLAPLTDETESDMTPPQPQDWIARAVEARPDLRQIESRLEVERQNARAARGLYSPAIALSGTWGFDRSGSIEYSSNDQASGGAIEVRWDLFTGGSREAKLRMAESAVTAVSARLRRARLAVASQVRQAVVAVGDAQGQIRLQRENLKTALENRRMVQAGYVAGREALTRLNEAQRDVLEADASLTLARIRLRRAWSDLNAAASAYPTALIDATGDESP